MKPCPPCHGDCNQGRTCDSRDEGVSEFPPLTPLPAVIAVALVAVAAAASAVFKLGFAALLP